MSDKQKIAIELNCKHCGYHKKIYREEANTISLLKIDQRCTCGKTVIVFDK